MVGLRRSALAPGRSADRGARWTTTTSMRALHAAVDAGVNFIDTADVYGDGHSERLVAQLRRERAGETIYVATKAGRRLPVQEARGLQPREPDGVGRSEPATTSRPTASTCCSCTARRGRLRRPRRLRRSSTIWSRRGRFGTTASASNAWTRRSKAIRHPGVKTVQIIFNMFRLRPAEQFFAEAIRRAGRHPGPRAAGERAADGQAHGGAPHSRPTTTGSSTAKARRSTRGRHFPAFRTTRAWPRSRNCARWCPLARRCRNWRCAGS